MEPRRQTTPEETITKGSNFKRKKNIAAATTADNIKEREKEQCHAKYQKHARQYREEYELQVTKLGLVPWTTHSIECLPWHITMAIYENLGHRDVVSLATASRATRAAVWHDERFWRRHFERCFGAYIPRLFCGSWRAAFLATANSELSCVVPNARPYTHTPSLDPQSTAAATPATAAGNQQPPEATPPANGQQQQQQDVAGGDGGEGWFHRVRRLERRMASFFGGAGTDAARRGGGGGMNRQNDFNTILVGVLGPGRSEKTDILRVSSAFIHSFIHSHTHTFHRHHHHLIFLLLLLLLFHLLPNVVCYLLPIIIAC